MNATLSLECSIMWFGTMFLTPEFQQDWVVWVHSCLFISKISQQPYSDLVSFAFHSVRTVVSYLIKTIFFILPGLVSRRSFSAASTGVRTIGCIDSFRWQCSSRCILTLIVCHNYTLWTQLDPRFIQSPINKAVSNCDSANHMSLKLISIMWYITFPSSLLADQCDTVE